MTATLSAHDVRRACDAQVAAVHREHNAMFGPQLYRDAPHSCRYPQCSCDVAFVAVEAIEHREAA